MSQPVTQPYIAEKGFTLIELMMAIVLVGILLGIGVPSFQSMMMNSRMTGDYNALTASLNFARSEAIKRSAPVSVCARATDDTCGDDWSVGWLVFDDAGDTPGFIDDGELVLKSALLDNANMTVNNSARLNTGAATPVERPFVQFGPCDERGTTAARIANISLAGSIRRGRKDGSGALLNVFNEAATCP